MPDILHEPVREGTSIHFTLNKINSCVHLQEDFIALRLNSLSSVSNSYQDDSRDWVILIRFQNLFRIMNFLNDEIHKIHYHPHHQYIIVFEVGKPPPSGFPLKLNT
jgi:hypothetical protein